MNKGIVMELKTQTLIVMTPDGAFEEIPRMNRICTLGEEILFSPDAKKAGIRSRWIAASSLVAAVVFCLVLFNSFPKPAASEEIVAYVSIDINPSIEIGVDENRLVRELRPLNADGEALIKDVVFAGRPIGEVTEDILMKADSSYLNKAGAEIVIASTLVGGKANFDDSQLSTDVKKLVDDHIRKKHTDTKGIEVTALAAPKEVREAAAENGLSPGKYAIYLNAKNNGVDVTVDEFKNESVSGIAKDNGGIGKLIGEGAVTRESLKELVKAEKDGSLDKKLGKLKTGKLADGKGKTPAPSVKPAETPRQPSLRPEKTSDPRQSASPNAGNGKNGRNNNKKNEDQKNVSPETDGKKSDGGKSTDSRNGNSNGQNGGDSSNGRGSGSSGESGISSGNAGKQGDTSKKDGSLDRNGRGDSNNGGRTPAGDGKGD